MGKRVALSLAAALGVIGLVAPAAHADGGWGDTEILGVTVNNGSDVLIGTTYAKTFDVTIYAYDDSGLLSADTTLEGPGAGFANDETICETDSECTHSFTFDPRVDLDNSQAGTWYVGSWVDALDDDYRWDERVDSFRLKRASTLTTNASPEPVTKGKTLTVTGTLKRASWDDHQYHGYTSQPVKLQFRKKGASTYTTVKTVNTSSTGGLKTTVTASTDGYWRWNFAGTTTTGAKTSTSDFVDVR
ncbi:calcium-binding protein [Streptomyces sp. NPDC006446]|uniref:calcium-binding protein n=1 Tax=Streptomyces sp. NPDC006446 TaxID=3154301 RepID=UPI0033AE1F31